MKKHPTYTDYMITEEGDVYSTKFGKLKKRKQHPSNRGYKTIQLCNDGKRKTYNVHRLVAQTYIPNPDNLPEVNHIDEDKTNNNIANLEWSTSQYNNEYSLAKSYIVEKVSTGERQIIFNLSQFARDFNMTVAGLLKTLKGRQYTHKGYKLIERIERTK